MEGNERAILKTLLYSSVFSFPLTQDEIYYYLIISSSISWRQFLKALHNMSPFLSKEEGYIALTSRKHSLKKRVSSEKEVVKKHALARKTSIILSLIPSIYFIGISGGVAVGDVKSDDDIDLFIISKRGTLYSTRLLALLLLQILGLRRSSSMKRVRNMICLNMLVDESGIKHSQRDLYTAHEIAQLYPLFERQRMYRRFLKANAWRGQFLAHTLKGRAIPYRKRKRSRFEVLIFMIEPLAKRVQLFFINRHRTTERVDDHALAFHPKDYRQDILHSFSVALKQHNKTINTIKQIDRTDM